MDENQFRDSELKAVFVAPDELMATMVKDMLEAEGIDALVRSDQIIWYDSIAKAGRGYWGKVFVRAEDEARARELVNEFLRLGATSGSEDAEGREDDDDLESQGSGAYSEGNENGEDSVNSEEDS